MQPEADESVPELATQPDDEPPAPAPPLSAQPGGAQNSAAQHSATQNSEAQHSATQGGAAQHSAAPNSGPQYSAAQSSAAPMSAPGNPGPINAAPYRANAGGTSAANIASLWNDTDRQRIRGRWQELQSKFLDDPHLVAGEAERLVQEAVASLTASLDSRRTQLHQQRATRGLDTENLRASLRDYREFLDRILGL